MTRVCIAGVTGWMGRPLAQAVAAADGLRLVSGVARSGAGEPLSTVVEGAEGSIYASAAEALDSVGTDVLMDYTSAEIVKENVLAALERGVAAVVGSSGLTADDYAEIDEKARRAGVGVIAAGNFSLLAALLLRSAAEAARHVAAWEIIDYASAGKPDVPSGTARELAERLGSIREPEVERPVGSLHGQVEARGATVGGAQVHSVRLPSFVVSTEIVFAAQVERLVIRHDPTESPEPYIAGTLVAVGVVGERVGLTRGLDSLLA
jgi:4-hydroxy-tetrahydrodipicolinate reductase